MARLPKPELYPSGGFSFTEADGTVLTSTSWDLLAVRLEEYRRLTNKPAGNPREEVMAQACERHPDICGEVGGKAFEINPAVKLGVGVQSWIAGVAIENAKTRLGRVDEPEAVRRAAICRRCPLNIAWQTSCTTCDKSLATVTADLTREGPEVNVEGLQGCVAFDQINAVAVRLKLPAKESPLSPAECWRRDA